MKKTLEEKIQMCKEHAEEEFSKELPGQKTLCKKCRKNHRGM